MKGEKTFRLERGFSKMTGKDKEMLEKDAQSVAEEREAFKAFFYLIF